MTMLAILTQDGGGIPGVQNVANDVRVTLTIIASLVAALIAVGLFKAARQADRKFWPSLAILTAAYVAFVMFINPDLIGGIASSIATWLSSRFGASG